MQLSGPTLKVCVLIMRPDREQVQVDYFVKLPIN